MPLNTHHVRVTDWLVCSDIPEEFLSFVASDKQLCACLLGRGSCCRTCSRLPAPETVLRQNLSYFLSRLWRPRICSSFQAPNGVTLHQSYMSVLRELQKGQSTIAALNNICRREGRKKTDLKAPPCKIGHPLVVRKRAASTDCLFWSVWGRLLGRRQIGRKQAEINSFIIK